MKNLFLFSLLLFLFCVPLSYGADMKTTRYFNATLVRGHALQKGELWVKGGEIISPQEKADEEIDVKGLLIAPGYIDLQLNGGFGVDFSKESEKVEEVAKKLPRFGITAFLPTVVSSSPERYRKILPQLQPRTLNGQGASILGIHLEGPFLSPLFKGAHDPSLLINSFNGNSLEKVYGSLAGVKIITFAPEIEGGSELAGKIKKKGIIPSLGHSGASYDAAKDSIEKGATFATHLFNGMAGFHHRDPHLIGAFLIQPKRPYSLIVDGNHLHPLTVLLCYRCNKEGLILISDAMEALGLPDGDYHLGTMDVTLAKGKVTLKGTDTLAGSVLSMDKAVQNFKKQSGCTSVEALEAASLKPAALLNLYPQKGSLDVGADADFNLLDEDLSLQACYIAGRLAWEKGK